MQTFDTKTYHHHIIALRLMTIELSTTLLCFRSAQSIYLCQRTEVRRLVKVACLLACASYVYDATYMMREESWRALVAMTESYEPYGLKDFDRVERMFSNLKPLDDMWKNVMGIIKEKNNNNIVK